MSKGGDEYEISGIRNRMYVKNGVALMLTGMGKVNAALSVFAALTDGRFDRHTNNLKSSPHVKEGRIFGI